MTLRYRAGWFGNSHGHSLAARGIKVYAASKQQLVEPIFYAQKKEYEIPFAKVALAIRAGKTYGDLVEENPGVDKEEIRVRGVKAFDTVHGSDALSLIERNGVDQVLRLSRMPGVGVKVRQVVVDRQAMSFIPGAKVQAIREGMSSQ